MLRGAVERSVDVPRAQVLVLLDLFEDGVGRGAGFFDVVGPAGVARGGFPEHACNHHRVGDDVGNAKRAQKFDDLADIGLFLELDFKGFDDRRLGHEPEAHFCADAVVGLGEHAVQRGPIAPLEYLPGLVALDATHARAEHVAIGQHHFHAALHQEVFAIGRVAHAAVHGVANRPGQGGWG